MNTETTIIVQDEQFFLEISPTCEDSSPFPLYPLVDNDVEMIVRTLTGCNNCYVACNDEGEIGITASFLEAMGIDSVNSILRLFGARMSQSSITFSIPAKKFIRCKLVIFPTGDIPF